MPQSFFKPTYQQSSLTLLLFFASWGVWWSFFQIWLTSQDSGLGLNGAQVGIIYSVNSLATLLIMVFYGTLQDKLGTRRHLSIFASAIAATVGPFAVLVYQPLLERHFFTGVVVGAIVLSAGFLAAFALFEAIAERISRQNDFEYGQARMWGSFGYAVMALIAGLLFTLEASLIFWAGSFFGVLLLASQLFWWPEGSVAKAAPASSSPPSLGEMLALFKIPSLWSLIVFVLFSWTFYTVYDQQMFPEFYTMLFSNPQHGQRAYGFLNATQVFIEAIMMGLIPLLMHRIGARNTLLLGTLVMFTRILGSAVFSDPLLISAVKMLHAIEVPMFVLAIFRYFTLHFKPELSATLYLVVFQISAQGGNVLLSPLLGALRDAIGYQPTFYVISAVVLVAGLYACLTMKKDAQGSEEKSDAAAGQAGTPEPSR